MFMNIVNIFCIPLFIIICLPLYHIIDFVLKSTLPDEYCYPSNGISFSIPSLSVCDFSSKVGLFKCSGLVHWDDPEGWDGEGGGRGVQDGEHM